MRGESLTFLGAHEDQVADPVIEAACPLPTKGAKGSYKKWKAVTPAMAAGLTDHVWTMDELLSFRVPPKSLWS